VPRFGLIGTITYDVITHEIGAGFRGLGGILHQAAILCGLNQEVFLYTNLGEELSEEFYEMTKNWNTLHTQGINRVRGPGNRVFLHYPQRGERIEVLKSVVPPLDPRKILQDMKDLDFLVLVMNSGFDLKNKDWQAIIQQATCPLWVDIHSLLLEKKLNSPRKYLSFPDWRRWTEGVHYFQANRAEVASMLGHPGEDLPQKDLRRFGKMALENGVRAVFVTLGKEGALVMTADHAKTIALKNTTPFVDSTGCGDVFCSGTAAALVEHSDPFDAAQFGLQLASAAAGVAGIKATYELSQKYAVSGFKHSKL
jgi:sugar/nucleoside kinase (ribokinase family)